MKNKTQAEVNDGPKHLMAINDLQSKVSKWSESIPDLVKRQSDIKIDYDNIKQNVQDLKHSKLDMNNVRNILSLNSSFLEKSNSLIAEVEQLINEIKTAELQWKEYEKNEDYQKVIADDLWKKIGDLNKKVEWFDLHFETSHLNLLSFKEILSKMRSMNDYTNDTHFINNLIDSVQSVNDKLPKIKEEFELNRQFINELNKHKHDFSEDSDINLLNDNTMRINRTIINVDE